MAESWQAVIQAGPRTVTGQLTRTLIWQFSTGDAGPWVTGSPASGPSLVTRDGTEVPVPAGDGAEVRLWHPVDATADEVRAWRRFLLDRQLAQPVKQAFREVYVLTPAEIETGDYSNRFAGHIFRQEQARALMKIRSWTPVPLAAWDDGIYHGTARRQDPHPDGQSALRAEFFFDPADEQDFTFKGLYSPKSCATSTCSLASPRSAPTPNGWTGARAGGSGSTGTAGVSGTSPPARRSATMSSPGWCPCWPSLTAAS